MLDPDVTEDLIYGGRLRIRQPARGYRVNLDTILLGASAPRGAMRLAEAGCGVGAPVMIAALNAPPEARLVGIERDPAAAELARANVAANGLADRVAIVTGDALAPAPEVFDAILCNPPYAAPGEGQVPAEARRSAHVSERPVGDWIKALSNRLAGGGSLTLIHRPARLPAILASLEGRLGGVSVFPVRPHAGAPAVRVLVRAVKGSRAPLALLAGLDLHPRDGGAAKHTPEAAAILSGQALVQWGGA